ncbi:MAG: hypothetical protein IVW54_14110 [Candidatus Binataceae bacterium]|nr:hypothetical protein [Candidatus Binataceae bacterium]
MSLVASAQNTTQPGNEQDSGASESGNDPQFAIPDYGTGPFAQTPAQPPPFIHLNFGPNSITNVPEKIPMFAQPDFKGGYSAPVAGQIPKAGMPDEERSLTPLTAKARLVDPSSPILPSTAAPFQQFSADAPEKAGNPGNAENQTNPDSANGTDQSPREPQ